MTIREMMAMYHSLQFVEELLDYIEQYPDDDYMTMECLCRKLVKYKLMKKIDGYYIADRKTEPQTCEWCKFYDGENCFSQEPCKVMPYFKTETQTDGYMTAEQAEDYNKMLDKAEHKVYGNIEDEPQTEREGE